MMGQAALEMARLRFSRRGMVAGMASLYERLAPIS